MGTVIRLEARFRTTTQQSLTVPISPYAPGMTTSTINALMAEMTPEEIELIPRAVRAWSNAGWMEPDEAVEWKLGAMAWAEYHDLPPETDPS